MFGYITVHSLKVISLIADIIKSKEKSCAEHRAARASSWVQYWRASWRETQREQSASKSPLCVCVYVCMWRTWIRAVGALCRVEESHELVERHAEAVQEAHLIEDAQRHLQSTQCINCCTVHTSSSAQSARFNAHIKSCTTLIVVLYCSSN